MSVFGTAALTHLPDANAVRAWTAIQVGGPILPACEITNDEVTSTSVECHIQMSMHYGWGR